MSKAKKDTKLLAITRDEAELVLYLVRTYDKYHPLLKALGELVSRWTDDYAKLREAEIRATANSFWEEDKTANILKDVRKDLKARHKKIHEEIAHLSPAEMKKMLNRKRGGLDV